MFISFYIHTYAQGGALSFMYEAPPGLASATEKQSDFDDDASTYGKKEKHSSELTVHIDFSRALSVARARMSSHRLLSLHPPISFSFSLSPPVLALSCVHLLEQDLGVPLVYMYVYVCICICICIRTCMYIQGSTLHLRIFAYV